MPVHRKLVVLSVCLAIFTSHLTIAAPGEHKVTTEKPTESTTEEKELLKGAESGSPSRIVKQINHVNEDNSYTVGHEAEDGTFKIETRSADGHIKGMFAYLDPASGVLKRFVYSTRPEDAQLIHPPTRTNLLPVADSANQEGKKAPAVRRQLRYRRPQGSESPEDPSPVLSMLLRRSRQGPRTDADELLRIQQQQQFYQATQGDAGDVYGSGYHVPDAQLRQHLLRGRVQNAVFRHLTPGQLSELQQYITPEARRALNPNLRALMSPVFDYLSNREELYDPYLYYPGQQVQYPRQYSGGYAAQSGLYDDLRHALLQRMLLAARLLGVEGGLNFGRYGGYDPDQYSDRLIGNRFYTQPDPRLAYNLRSLPYQQALQIARETHERQLAAYQASIAAQGGAIRTAYNRGEAEPTPFLIHASDTTPGGVEYEQYSTVTPASVIRATSARPSNIQRVRNVQVIPAASPAPSTTANPRGY